MSQRKFAIEGHFRLQEWVAEEGYSPTKDSITRSWN